MVVKPTVGIDLGTTNTFVARVNPACHTEMLRDREGSQRVPSLVLLEDNSFYVGEEARLRAVSRPDRLLSCFKRHLGGSSPVPSVAGVFLPAEVVQACILARVRDDVVRRVGTDFGTVIAVPSFFRDPQRKATADAGEIAGLEVLDLVNEPVAAALAFSEHTGFLSPGASPRDKLNLLVFDLGGFSFNVTLLEVQEGGLKTVAADYDLHLGGHDWDFRLADYVAEQFAQRFGDDPRRDQAGRDALLSRAERAKRSLGLRHVTTVSLLRGSRPLEVSVTLEQFQSLTADLLDRTRTMTNRLLQGAGLGWRNIARVLLVGGATRMPAVRRMLADLSGREPDHTVHPEEAVARGAAIYASQLQATATVLGQTPRFQVTNIAAHSLGVLGTDPQSGRKVNKILIPRGTPLPTKVTRKFVPGIGPHRAITIVVVEGESPDGDDCTIIGRATIDQLPAEINQEWPVDVTYEYTASGRLNVEVRVRYTDRAVHLALVRATGLSRAQIRAWKELVTAGAGLTAMGALVNRERHPPIAVASTGEPAAEEGSSLSALAQRYATYLLRAWRSRPATAETTAEKPAPAAAADTQPAPPPHDAS